MPKPKTVEPLAPAAPPTLAALLLDVGDAAELLVEQFDKISGNDRDAFVGSQSTARAIEIVRYVVREFVPRWREQR